MLASTSYSQSFDYDLSYTPNDPQPTEKQKMIEGISNRNKVMFVCGKKLNYCEKRKYISTIVDGVLKYSEIYGIEPWGVLAVFANESNFDYCAIGPGPRNYGISSDLIKKKKTTISYSKEQVFKIILNKQAQKVFGFSGFDIGLCQLLTRFYTWDETNILNIEYDLERCFKEFKKRADKHKTNQPWLYWRGSKKVWYQKKINRIRTSLKKETHYL